MFYCFAGFIDHIADAVPRCNKIAGSDQSGEDVPERLPQFISVAQETNGRVSPDVNLFFSHF